MKRFTFRLTIALLTFTIGVVAAALWVVSRIQPPIKLEPQPSSAATLPPASNTTIESSESPASEIATYRDVATYIENRVVALKGKVTGFGAINRARNVYVKEYPFQPIVDYRHRFLRWKPVPDSEPRMEEAVFAKDGFMLVVWMVRGEVTWEPSEPPVTIGPFKVAVDINGPQRERIKPIIDRIVADAAYHFNRTAQSNNGMHPTADTKVLK